MESTSEIRNRLIDSLTTINNSDYLSALDKMISSSNVKEKRVPLTEEHVIMLSMSEDDIKNGRVIDQASLNREELKWLKEG
ncbi:MAG: hypothetical protein RIF33_20820 [Cyclobacteriaceae bacterium]